MEELKKGILLGMGISNLNKKEVHDFVSKLHSKGYLRKHEADDLVTTIISKKKDHNLHLDSKIEHYVKDILKREQLATLEHIDYLEKRLELLEDEVDRLLLEREIENASDEEIDDLLKELGINPDDLESLDEEHHVSLDNVDGEFDHDELLDDLLELEEDDLAHLLKDDEFEGHRVDVKKAPKVKVKKAKSTKKKAKKAKKSTKKDPQTQTIVIPKLIVEAPKKDSKKTTKKGSKTNAKKSSKKVSSKSSKKNSKAKKSTK